MSGGLLNCLPNRFFLFESSDDLKPGKSSWPQKKSLMPFQSDTKGNGYPSPVKTHPASCAHSAPLPHGPSDGHRMRAIDVKRYGLLLTSLFSLLCQLRRYTRGSHKFHDAQILGHFIVTQSFHRDDMISTGIVILIPMYSRCYGH
jgi:hypothetical protein